MATILSLKYLKKRCLILCEQHGDFNHFTYKLFSTRCLFKRTSSSPFVLFNVEQCVQKMHSKINEINIFGDGISNVIILEWLLPLITKYFAGLPDQRNEPFHFLPIAISFCSFISFNRSIFLSPSLCQ